MAKNYDGSIIIGTKIDNSGLEKGLKETKKELKKFDDEYKDVKITGPGFENIISDKDKKRVEEIRKEIEQIEKVRAELYKKEEAGIITPEETKQLNDYIKKTEKLFDMWEQIEAYNYDNPQWGYKIESVGDPRSYRMLMSTVEETKEQLELAKKINNMSEEELEASYEKRKAQAEEYWIMQDQKAAQADLLRYEEARQRLNKERPDFSFDIGIDESKYDTVLTDYRAKVNFLSQDLDKLFRKREGIVENIANLEKEISAFEREKGEAAASTKEYEELINKQIQQQNKLEDTDLSVEKLTYSYEKLIEKAKEYAGTLDQNIPVKLDGISGSLEGISGKISKISTKMTRWLLGIFSIRSAYMFVRQAMNTLLAGNEELNAKVERIRYALAAALEPVIISIVNWVWKLINYLNYIWKAWFGVDLLARGAELSTKKMADNVGSAAGAAKELRKQLAGFDEMNILGDNVNASGGGAGGVGGAGAGDFELEDVEIPGWVDWIAKNKDSILKTLRDIAIAIGIAFATVKVLEFLGVLSKISSALGGLSGLQIFGLLAGVAITIAGIVKTVSAIIDFINDPSWGNFVEILEGISIILVGIGIIAGSMGQSWGWIMAAVGALGFLITSLIDTRSNSEKLAEAQENLKNAENELKDACQEQVDALHKLRNARDQLKETTEKLGISEDELMSTGKTLAEQIAKNPDLINELSDADLELYETYLNVIGAEQDLVDAGKKVVEKQKEQTKASLEVAKYKAREIGTWDEYKKAIMDAYNEGAISAVQAQGKMEEVYWNVDKEAKKTFYDDIPKWYKNTWDALAQDITVKIDADTSKANQKIVGLAQTLKDLANQNFNIDANGNAKGALIGFPRLASGGIIGRIPRLASGGLINRPGKGVPLAIGGEAGREGIIPLTDDMAMARLGREIGKNVNISAEIPVSIGDRQIARIVRQVMAESDFAYNR